MERNLKISIPEPCHENWDKMTPNKNGRFCLSCSKTVVDFTSMLPDEIQHFFIQNQNNKICGRFRKSQLDSVTIQIPSQVLYSQTNYRKMFLLALFIAMGTTLFSCADKEGKKKKIEKVEVVTDTVPTENVMVGKPAIDESNPLQAVVPPPPPPPPKNDRVKFVHPNNKENCASEKPQKKANTKNNASKEPIYVSGEIASQTYAEFPGGIEQFYNFFAKEFKTPEGIYTKNLKIKVSFAVEKDGSLHYMQSEPVIEQALEQEIIRVLKVSPKWKAGQSGSKKIRMQYSLPITF